MIVPDFLIRPLLYLAVIAAVFGTGFIKGCQHGNAELVAYQAKELAESAKVLASAEARNARNAESWRNYARQIDTQNAAAVAANTGAVNAAAGMRLFDPGRESSGSAQAGEKAAAGVPAGAAAGTELSRELVAFLVSQAGIANTAAIYARDAREVALACLARSDE